MSPSEVGVLDDVGDNRLTLTACHPKYSARQRIIVVAALVGEAAPAPGTPTGPATGAIPGDGETSGGTDSGTSDELSAATVDGGLSGERAAIWPAIALGVACALIWIAAWLLGTLWSKWPAYLLCLPLFLLMLFFFFENFSRVLPANF